MGKRFATATAKSLICYAHRYNINIEKNKGFGDYEKLTEDYSVKTNSSYHKDTLNTTKHQLRKMISQELSAITCEKNDTTEKDSSP